MTQPHFDGPALIPSDHPRLKRQLDRVIYAINSIYSVQDGLAWWSLKDLSIMCQCSEASVSARLRDLRKPRFGGHLIERKRLDGGQFLYRLGSKT